jgi:hypothetical protein
MPIAIPNTGSEIRMGGVNRAYTTSSSMVGTNISLRATLGSYIGISTGSISLSSAFGGRTGPYDYI